jgi:hypothetical protein
MRAFAAGARHVSALASPNALPWRRRGFALVRLRDVAQPMPMDLAAAAVQAAVGLQREGIAASLGADAALRAVAEGDRHPRPEQVTKTRP